MAKIYEGRVAAFISREAPGNTTGKAIYRNIGAWYTDPDHPDRPPSLKIDTLPLPGSGWDGWVNLFHKDEGKTPSSAKEKFSTFPEEPF